MILGNRLTRQEALKDGVATMGDGGDLRRGLCRGGSVVTCVFAERTFPALIVVIPTNSITNSA